MDPEPELDSRRLLRLARRLVDHQETDRRRISSVLHDEVGQLLTALKLTLTLPGLAAGGEEAESTLEEARQLTEEALERVRDVTLDLRPSMLDDLGLEDTLNWYLRRSSRQAGLDLELDVDGLDPRPPSRVETACFRVVQEAVGNVLAHAGASRLCVRVRRPSGRLELEVSDDGRGFDAAGALERAREGSTYGLSGMEERLMLQGGTLEVDSVEGRGTRLRAVLPLEDEASGRGGAA